MSPTAPTVSEEAGELDFLGVESFLKTLVDARALKTALDLRVIDHLAVNHATPFADLAAWFPGDRRGLRLLVSLLRANHVVEECNGHIALSRQFRRALRYRDLLETKLEFTQFVLSDFAALFTTLIRSPEALPRRSRTAQLFCYDRALRQGTESSELTKRWMRITTCLTKYESRVCMRYHDFQAYERVLDIGGNSGEFVLQICRSHPTISATVFDLPGVCEIGEQHVRGEPESSRIAFLKGSALTDPLPGGQDLVTFKSMLHDWPDREARQLLVRGSQALRRGGTLLIFERAPLEIDEAAPSFSMIPFLLFFRSFRSPVIYREQLEALGFEDIEVKPIRLETPFFLVTGRKRN